jgi:tRNA dimethylallyltransferase
LALFKGAIVITGPTASGKTDAAIRAAKYFNTEIVSFDSRQLYAEMQIGTAVPEAHQLAQVKHHFIRSHSIHDEMNANLFAETARPVIEQILQQHQVVVLTGGTGLYLNALLMGLHSTPGKNIELRNNLEIELKEQGLEYLTQKLRILDNKAYQTIDLKNPRRVIRALEMIYLTGLTQTNLFQQPKETISFDYKILVLNPDRKVLYHQINTRVDNMIQAGLLGEAENLYAFKHLKALHTVGYSELFDYLDGSLELNEAVEKIKQHTRNYAKRQITWFKKYDQAIWITPEQIDDTLIANFS